MKAATSLFGLYMHERFISIHAAREGGDRAAGRERNVAVISIHAAREGGDTSFYFSGGMCPIFQSTPPVKAATFIRTRKNKNGKFQSTPPVKAATQKVFPIFPISLISIHAAREGGDPKQIFVNRFLGISIHAAREGGDESVGGLEDYAFISIHAAREGGDVSAADAARRVAISIHAAREGGDARHVQSTCKKGNFNPRRP